MLIQFAWEHRSTSETLCGACNGHKKRMIKAAIDWGSSSFRAYRFNENGAVVDRRSRELGIKFVANTTDSPDNNFKRAFFEQIGDWLTPGDSVLLSGMITSVNGWHETPYIECPTRFNAITTGLSKLTVDDINLLFLPGICQRSPGADVMRGEELQLIGASKSADKALMVMPGTHSKWAMLEKDTIVEFHTIATGELYDVLLNQSLIGQLADNRVWRQEQFLDGVSVGYNSNAIVRQLFTCRSGVLLNTLDKDSVSSYLSGLLIGNEIREGLAIVGRPHANSANLSTNDSIGVTLIGASSLCTHYRSAFRHLNLSVALPEQDSAEQGFVKLVNHQNREQI